MAIKPCKVCTSEHRAVIESMILSGDGFESIADKCTNELDFEVSFMTLQRHFKNHMKDLHDLRRTPQTQQGITVDAYQAKTYESIELPQVKTKEQAIAIMKSELPQIVANALLLLKQKQQYAARGQASVNASEILAIQRLMELLE